MFVRGYYYSEPSTNVPKFWAMEEIENLVQELKCLHNQRICMDNVAFSFLHSIFRTFSVVWQYKIEDEARALTGGGGIQVLPGQFLFK